MTTKHAEMVEHMARHAHLRHQAATEAVARATEDQQPEGVEGDDQAGG